VGYAAFTLNADLAAHLRAAGVERLIDVRALASSRRPGFAKTALSAALAAQGIEYMHMRALGNPKAGRELYRRGRVAEGRALFERHLLGEQRAALAELAHLIAERRCALMCVEAIRRSATAARSSTRCAASSASYWTSRKSRRDYHLCHGAPRRARTPSITRPARSKVKTYREGVAARVGHDLVIDVAKWDATVEVGRDGAITAIALHCRPALAGGARRPAVA